jgi:hypothetical protein
LGSDLETEMAKLPMAQRLAVLALFQATVAVAYLSIIEVNSLPLPSLVDCVVSIAIELHCNSGYLQS